MNDINIDEYEGALTLISLRRSTGVYRGILNMGKYICGFYGDYNDTFKECPICLKNFTRGRIIYCVKSCGRLYHRHCIDKWIKTGSTCPCCRTKIIDR